MLNQFKHFLKISYRTIVVLSFLTRNRKEVMLPVAYVSHKHTFGT